MGPDTFAFPLRPHTEELVRYALRRLDSVSQIELEFTLTEDTDSRRRFAETWKIMRELASGDCKPENDSELEARIRKYWQKWSGPYVLPRWESPFVGRDEELASLRQFLRSDQECLLSVIGEGGMGKTRLACEVAMGLSDFFREGVHFIGCGTLSSRTDVLSALAMSFGAEADADLSTLQTILESKHALIYLDSCEYVADVKDLIADLLPHSSRCKWLITSRKPLDLPQETVLALGADPNLVTILLSRVEKLLGSLKLSAHQSELLTNVGKRLGSIPLNLSLAAGFFQPGIDIDANIKALHSDILAASHSAPRVTDDSAIRILIRSEERLHLLQLTVFSGWFTSNDAASVMNLSNEVTEAILSDLATRERIDRDFEGTLTLYKLSDPIRDRLQRSAQQDSEVSLIEQARDRHSLHYADVASQIGESFRTGSWKSASLLLQLHRLNLRTATERLSQTRQDANVARMSNSLSHPYFESGYLADFEILSKAAQETARRTNDLALEASLLGLQGALSSRRSDDEQARNLWVRRLEICKEIGDIRNAADALIDLAWLTYDNSGKTAALAYLEEAEKLVEEARLIELAATVAVIRARMYIDDGEREEGLKWVERTNELIAQSTDQNPLLFVYQNLVRAYQHCQMPHQAAEVLNTLLRIAIPGDRTFHIGWSLRELSPIFEAQGDLDNAEKCLVQSTVVYREYQTKHVKRASELLEEFCKRHGRNVSEAVQRWASTPIEPLD